MAVRNIIFSFAIILFLLNTPMVFSQTKGSVTSVYELMPMASVSLRVYHLKDEEIKKIQMPNNYMMVKRPEEGKIYIWEFPAVTQKDDAFQKQEKGSKEKEGPPNEAKPPAIPNLLELSKHLGIGQIKEGTTADVLKSLLNK